MDRTILVVDDEQPIADILKIKLEKEGYQVHVAYDGEDALVKVEEIQPDLILLDLEMPIKDGREVDRWVGALPDNAIRSRVARWI